MSWPTTFASLAAGNQPLSLFDGMFAQVAQMTAIPCTAAGFNTIVLTPNTNSPQPTVYQNFTSARFVAVANSNAPVTIQIGSLVAALPAYLSDGATQVTTQLTGGLTYLAIFCQSLNGGAGGFFIDFGLVANAPTSSSFTLLNTLIANNSATLSDTTHITNAFNIYLISFESVLPASNAVALQMQVSTNGGSSYISTSYTSAAAGMDILGTANVEWDADASTSAFLLTGAGTHLGGLANTATYGFNGLAIFQNPNSANLKHMFGTSVWKGASQNNISIFGGIYTGATTGINAIQFSMSSGNITSGVIRLYGVSQ